MSRPRIRSLKPEMWADEKIGALSMAARLLFVGLITMADDEGRLRDLAPAIIGHVFPHDNPSTKRLAAWMQELELVSLIVRYEVAGKGYVVLPGWRHQKVNRPNPSELPPPPGSRNDHGSITEPSGNVHELVTDRSRPRARGGDRIGSNDSGTKAAVIPCNALTSNSLSSFDGSRTRVAS